MDRLKEIREQERLSHTETYRNYVLYQKGSWMHNPVKSVLDLLPHFAGYSEVRVLDLGCGVGRNSIAIAQHFSDISCHIECIDLLDVAIEKLKENAEAFHVSKNIQGITMPLEKYPIKQEFYDLVLGISALEHSESEELLIQTLEKIRDGVRNNGIVCLIINSDVQEFNTQTGLEIPAQFEVNMTQYSLLSLLEQIFKGWTVLKSTVHKQQYDIPRGNIISDLHTNVITYAVRKR